MQQQSVEMLAPPMEAPPATVWDAVWPVVAPLFTPSTIGALALTIFVVHTGKSIASYLTDYDDMRESWVFFCTMLSVITGTVVGSAFWISGEHTWTIVPLCAFGAGPVWRLLQALLPEKVADVLLTETDRKLKRELD